MDRSPHSPDGSDTPELDDALADGILAGDPDAVARHPELADLLADVRVAYRSGAPRVRDPLAALLSPHTLDPAPRSTMSLSAPRRVARFALAVVVTAIASGGLALAGALPGTLSEDTSSEPTETTVDTTTPDTTTPDTTVPEPEESEEESEYKNHGQEVSEFARTTELEGCEKGRAVSELASGKDLSHRPPCGTTDDEDEDLDDDEDDEDDEDVEAESSEGSSGGPGNRGKAPGHAKR